MRFRNLKEQVTLVRQAVMEYSRLSGALETTYALPRTRIEERRPLFRLEASLPGTKLLKLILRDLVNLKVVSG